MKKKKNILLAFFIPLLTVIITYVFIKPVLDTQDDVFAEYMLGKGFSTATLHTTYFEYGFLFYEKLFSFLYQNLPSVNWLTIFYIFLHLVSATFILNIFLKKPKTTISIFIIVAYLFLFFIPFITRLSYTAAGAHCIVSSLFILFDSINQKETPPQKKICLVFILITLAAGLRANILLPFFIIILPFFFLPKKEVWVKWSITFGAVILVTAIAFLIHENEYVKNIPNWSEIKNVTNAFYQLNNFGYDKNKIADEKDSFKKAAFQMVSNNFIYSDTLLNTKFLNEMNTSASIKITGNKKEVYWFFTDIKQYLIILVIAVVYFLLFLKKSRFKNIMICSNAITVMVLTFFILFMRLPERIWLPLLLLVFLIDLFPLLHAKPNEFHKFVNHFFAVVALVVIILQARRIKDIYEDNSEGIKNFICANEILKQHPQNLFIEYNNAFPFNDFPALSLPSQYSFSNILFPFFFNTELRSKTMQQFNVIDIDHAISSSDKIILVGNVDTALADYVYQTQRQKISFEKISSPTSCVDLYKVNVVK